MSPKRKPSDLDDLALKEREQPSRPADPAVVNRERGAFEGSVAVCTVRQREKKSTAQPRGPPAEAALEAISAKLAAIAAAEADADAYSIIEFCERHRISVQMYYKLAAQGLAPQTFRVGTRVLVSKEAAARWRAEREAATLAEATATISP